MYGLELIPLDIERWQSVYFESICVTEAGMFGILVSTGFGYFLMENNLVWIGKFNSQFIETFLNTALHFPFDGSLLMCFGF